MHLNIIALALVTITTAAFAEPKAYELVKYRGKTAAGLTIAFDFGDGYPEASEVRITDRRGKFTTRFVRIESGNEETMRFVPEKDPNDGRVVVLKMSPDSAAAKTIEGTYQIEQNTLPFTLKRQ